MVRKSDSIMNTIERIERMMKPYRRMSAIACMDVIANMTSTLTAYELDNMSAALTSNYYIVEQGADVELLNSCCYRIVNREIKARLKRDCHSVAVGTLHTGQVVIVRDKDKKWIQVGWKNKNRDTCLGWIQNYKVSEFIHEKEKGAR